MNSADPIRDHNSPTNAELVNQNSFEKLRSKNRRKEIFRRIFYLFLALILMAFVVAISIYLFFRMREVKIRGNDRYTADEILAVCGFEEETNLFAVDLDKVEEAILKKFPYIRDVSFKRVLPSTLVITVDEDSPKYCAEIHGDWFLLSKDLRVISRHDYYEEIEVLSLPVTYLLLPEIDYAVAGDVITFSHASAYRYLTGFLDNLSHHSFYAKIDCIDATDRYHIDLYAGNGRYFIELGNADSLDSKLNFVEAVLRDPTFTDKTIASFIVEYIDKAIVSKQEHPFEYR
jgi:hypothetical protein